MAITPKNSHDDLTVMKQRVFMWAVVFVLVVIACGVIVYYVFVQNGGWYKKYINTNISVHSTVNQSVNKNVN